MIDSLGWTLRAILRFDPRAFWASLSCFNVIVLKRSPPFIKKEKREKCSAPMLYMILTRLVEINGRYPCLKWQWKITAAMQFDDGISVMAALFAILGRWELTLLRWMSEQTIFGLWCLIFCLSFELRYECMASWRRQALIRVVMSLRSLGSTVMKNQPPVVFFFGVLSLLMEC